MRKAGLFVGFIMLALVLLCSCSDDSTTGPSESKAPTVTTLNVSAVTMTTAECGGNITSDGGANVTARGVCWSTNTTPTTNDNITSDGTGTGSFASSLAGLTNGTQYYVRAYATNSVGTGYGDTQSFTTDAAPATMTDVDGNVYKVVTIGSQVWMAENLRVTHYRNGDEIPYDSSRNWSGLTTGAYCKYDNSDDTAAIYGLLYNWYAATDIRNIAPAGWHVPSQAEWEALDAYLGENAGGKLKETGMDHWEDPNLGATNETGFTGLPGGVRGWESTYANLGTRGRFLSATWNDLAQGNVTYDLLSWDSILSPVGDWPWVGASIRCIKD